MSCTTCCIPLLIPLLSYSLADKYLGGSSITGFLAAGSVKFATVFIIFLSTWIVSSIKCRGKNKSNFLRSFAPTAIFIAWIAAFYAPFPPLTVFMRVFGTNVFFMIALSFLYKMVYDYTMVCP